MGRAATIALDLPAQAIVRVFGDVNFETAALLSSSDLAVTLLSYPFGKNVRNRTPAAK